MFAFQLEQIGKHIFLVSQVAIQCGSGAAAVLEYRVHRELDRNAPGIADAFLDTHSQLQVVAVAGAEIAAGLGIVLIVTGLYMAWPRGSVGWRQALVPDLSTKGRVWWKSLHVSVAFWISVVLTFFLVTGLAWSGVWGGKFEESQAND